MRLLQRIEEDIYRLTKRFVDGDKIPPYAILSHTWGEDVDEVTFADLSPRKRLFPSDILFSGEGTISGDDLLLRSDLPSSNDTYKSKTGYEKVRFCGEQAHKDGLDYFWIDTGCIDKEDEGELVHAIKSMYRWYQKATKCYVYLPDVSTLSTDETEGPRRGSWKLEFRKSRWFTRGWTLQELIAPPELEFFSRQAERLGSRSSLVQQIHEITGIPCSALQGAPLSQFSISERLSWKRHRQTKVPEDGAYALMGLIDVDLRPIYGEGSQMAFRRLHGEVRRSKKCVQDIRLTDPRDDKTRIEDTKGGLLQESYRWILDHSSFEQWQNDPLSRLLWIKGDPGKGKTMLLCGVINELEKSSRGATTSYFFCQAADSRINSATAVLRGLLYLLLSQQPSLVHHARAKYDQAESKVLFEDANAWYVLTEIFTSVLQDYDLPSTYLIIDALDECTTDLPKLLDFIVNQSTKHNGARWLISSRNLSQIEEKLHFADEQMRLSLEVNAFSVANAVAMYIRWKTSLLAEQKGYDSGMRDAVLQHLTKNANDTFLWVALVFQVLERTSKWNVLKKLGSFPPGLNPLYRRMLRQISEYDDDEICKLVLATVTLAYRPLALEEVVALNKQLQDIADDMNSVEQLISQCGSLLTIRSGVVYFVHQSAKDFILAECTQEIFPIGKDHVHHILLTRSIEIMSKDLRRDIYSLNDPGFPIEKVTKPDPDPLAASRYSCIYWIEHLCNSRVETLDRNSVDMFLRKKYIYWLEALSLEASVTKGVVLMAKLHSLYQTQSADSFSQLVYDAHRFIMLNRLVIETYPLQSYAAALLFCPTGSLVRNYFQSEEPHSLEIRPEQSLEWSACLLTVECPSKCVVFSNNSKMIACAAGRDITIWDASSGECLRALDALFNCKASMAFSHDSIWLAAVAQANAVKIWHVNNGVCHRTLEGHTSFITAIALSPSQVASGADDGTIKIWDRDSGTCLQTMKGHDRAISALVFPDHRLASATGNGELSVWDSCSGARLSNWNHNEWGPIAISHDVKLYAWTLDEDNSIEVYSVQDGTRLRAFYGHTQDVTSIAFSHESNWLISASYDATIRIWDTANGRCLQTFSGQGRGEVSPSFDISHDSRRLASIVGCSSVRIWDTNTGSVDSTNSQGHGPKVEAMAFSRDSLFLATGSYTGIVKIWDCESGACLKTLEGCGEAISVDLITFSDDSERLAICNSEGYAQVWDVSDKSSASLYQKLEVAYREFHWTAMLLDPTQLIVCYHEGTVKFWDISSHICTKMIKVGEGNTYRVAFSQELNQLACVSLAHITPTLLKKNTSVVTTWDMGRDVYVRLRTRSTQGYVWHLYYDTMGTHLQTEHGPIGMKPETLLMDISHDGKWITSSGNNVLRIPLEYRTHRYLFPTTTCKSICGTKVAILTQAGYVWLCVYTGR